MLQFKWNWIQRREYHWNNLFQLSPNVVYLIEWNDFNSSDIKTMVSAVILCLFHAQIQLNWHISAERREIILDSDGYPEINESNYNCS